MLVDVTEVEVTGRHRLRLRFADGTVGEADVSKHVEFRGVFELLRQEAEFSKVRVDSELGTIAWLCGADLDPDVLYAQVKGEGINLGARGHRPAS